MKKAKVPWRELDTPIVGLVKLLNEVPYIITTSSCQGEEDVDKLRNLEVKAHDPAANAVFYIQPGYERETERLM